YWGSGLQRQLRNETAFPGKASGAVAANRYANYSERMLPEYLICATFPKSNAFSVFYCTFGTAKPKTSFMKLKDVLAISGQEGLFKFVAQSRNGIIVESLADGTRTCAPATARVSSLGEIAIFTDGEDMPLAEVFQKIYEKCEGKQTI